MNGLSRKLKKLKKKLEAKENENTTVQNCSKCSYKEFYRNISLSQEEKSQIHNLNLHLKKQEKEHQIKPRISRRRDITMIRAEINDIQVKKKK